MKNILHKILILPIVFAAKGLEINSKLRVLAELEVDLYNHISEFQNDKFRKLINVAVNKSKYYRKVFCGMNINSLKDLSTLPTLNKTILNELNLCDISTGIENATIIRRTTGTTGKPVTVYVDKESLAWQLATRYHFYKWYGIEPGDREARFWGRPLKGYSFKVQDYLLNRRRFSFININKFDLLKEYDRFVKFKPDYLYGYSSLILSAAQFISSENLSLVTPLKAVICTAECISKHQKQYIENIFGCPVIEEYGCSEVDIIAFECPSRKLHVATFSKILEATLSNEALVTDLDNLLMPLIRYNLGDTIELSDQKCSCGRNLPFLNKVGGRTIEQLVRLDNGGSFHAVAFAYMLEDLAEKGYVLKQFKIIQCGKTILFELDMDDKRDDFARELEKEFYLNFSNELQFKVEFKPIVIQEGKKHSYFECICPYE